MGSYLGKENTYYVVSPSGTLVGWGSNNSNNEMCNYLSYKNQH